MRKTVHHLQDGMFVEELRVPNSTKIVNFKKENRDPEETT